MTDANKKDIIKDSTIYISSNYVAQVLGFVISIATKRFLGPSMVGVWQIVQVILGYCGYASLGTTKAAFREIPYYKGRGEFDKAEKVKNEVFTFIFMMACIPAIGVALYAFWTKGHHDNYFFVGMLYVALIVILQRLYDYYTTLLRANKEFGIIGKITVISAVLNFIFVFLLVKPLKIYGLFVASFLSALIGYAYVYYKTRYIFRFQLSKEGLGKLLNIGIPLLMTGLCFQTIRSIDKILIAKYLGVAALGNYSIAMMVHQYVVGVPNMLAVVLYPRLQEKFGERGSAAGIKNYLIYPILTVGFITFVLIGISILVVPTLVEWALPQFTEGIATMKIFLWGTFFFAVGQQASTFLITLDKQWKMIPIYLTGIISILALDYFFIRNGYGIQGVALGVALGALIYNFIMIIYAKSNFASGTQLAGFLLVLALGFIYYFTVVNLLDQWILWGNLWDIVIKLVVFFAMSIPPGIYLDRQTRAITTLRETLLAKLQKSRKK